MDWKATGGMIDPDDDHESAFARGPDHGVVRHVPSDLLGLDPLDVAQRLRHLGSSDPPLRMISLQVADVRRIPDHRTAIH